MEEKEKTKQRNLYKGRAYNVIDDISIILSPCYVSTHSDRRRSDDDATKNIFKTNV